MNRSYREFKARAGKAVVRFGFSTRHADYPGFYNDLKKRGAIAVPEQTHSAHVKRITDGAASPRKAAHGGMSTDSRDIKNCDALITTAIGRIMTVRTADCLPIFLWDSKGNAVAMVHAGWKGTHQKIAVKTVGRFKRLGVKPENVRVVFGPAIRSCCYQVGPEFSARFPALTLKKSTGDRLQFDLVLANRLQLAAAGVPTANCRDMKLCTACDAPTFFSFRREAEKAGRMIHWIYREVI
jgi:hypothetical protein